MRSAASPLPEGFFKTPLLSFESPTAFAGDYNVWLNYQKPIKGQRNIQGFALIRAVLLLNMTPHEVSVM